MKPRWVLSDATVIYADGRVRGSSPTANAIRGTLTRAQRTGVPYLALPSGVTAILQASDRASVARYLDNVCHRHGLVILECPEMTEPVVTYRRKGAVFQ